MSESQEAADPAPRVAAVLSGALFALGATIIVAVGGLRYLRDGTLWMDEAGVALSLLELSPDELFGRLIGGYSFPRPYLLAIAGLQGALGFETWVLRLLPFLAFALGTAAWIGLFWRRFRSTPWLLALGVALVAIPSSWPVYGAMFKQYSLDVAVALVPFLLSDRFYRETLREGRRPLRLFGLAVFCALSFTYAFALLGRLVGFYAAGLAERRFALDRRGVASAVAGIALFSACLVWTDLRHTAGEASLYGFWQACLIDESVSKAARSIEYFLFGWYFGRLEFVPVAGLPWAAHAILRGAFALGALRLALQLFRPAALRTLETSDARAWGSRSLGAAAMLCGFLIAASVVRYPVCPGRLTVFALFALQLVTLEGLDFVRGGLGRLQGGAWIATLLGCALVAAVAPTSIRSARAVATAPTPEDFRPLLPAIAGRPEVPVLPTPCSTKQAQTVPEWLGRSPVVAWTSWMERGGEEVFVLNAKRSEWCQRFVRRVEAQSDSWQPLHDEHDSAELYLARIAADPRADLPSDRGTAPAVWPGRGPADRRDR